MAKQQVFIGWLRSIEIDHPPFKEKIKAKIKEFENDNFSCVIFAVPKKRDTEIIESIGKLINDKL